MQADLFDGRTYSAPRDESRLFAQLEDVLSVMRDGEWHTLDAISAATGHPQASVSARLRDLRKPRWGSHTVERAYVERGLFKYRMTV